MGGQQAEDSGLKGQHVLPLGDQPRGKRLVPGAVETVEKDRIELACHGFKFGERNGVLCFAQPGA